MAQFNILAASGKKETHIANLKTNKQLDSDTQAFLAAQLAKFPDGTAVEFSATGNADSDNPNGITVAAGNFQIRRINWVG